VETPLTLSKGWYIRKKVGDWHDRKKNLATLEGGQKHAFGATLTSQSSRKRFWVDRPEEVPLKGRLLSENSHDTKRAEEGERTYARIGGTRRGGRETKKS